MLFLYLYLITISFNLFSCSSIFFHADEVDRYEINFHDKKSLLISFGDGCSIATSIKQMGYRVAAFPFDWIVSNFEKIDLLLSNNFVYLFDPLYLMPSIRFPNCLENTLYDIHFAHDFPTNVDKENPFGIIVPNWIDFLEEVARKYQKRIQRFRSLANYKGKIYFLHNNLYKRGELNEVIIKKIQERLFEIFPLVDFELLFFIEHGLSLDIKNLSNVRVVKTKHLGCPTSIQNISNEFRSCLESLGFLLEA